MVYPRFERLPTPPEQNAADGTLRSRSARRQSGRSPLLALSNILCAVAVWRRKTLSARPFAIGNRRRSSFRQRERDGPNSPALLFQSDYSFRSWLKSLVLSFCRSRPRRDSSAL